jgi:glycerol-3-phosphate acyltransferase PlsY
LEYAPILAAFAAVAGHVLPVWLRFRGGKGMATSIGVVVALAPFCVLLSLVSWYLVFLFSRYVSLASLVAAVVLPLCGLVHRQLRPGAVSVPTIVLLFVLSAVIIVTHRANIKRLLRGREHRFTRTSRR